MGLKISFLIKQWWNIVAPLLVALLILGALYIGINVN